MIRPLHDNLLIKLHPKTEYSSIIEIPDSAKQAHPIQTAEVISAGPGRWVAKKAGQKKRVFVETTVPAGCKIAFFTAAAHNRQGSDLCFELPDDHALIRESDILFAYEGECPSIEV